MTTTFFAFGMADSMFPENCTLVRDSLDLETFQALVTAPGVVSALNPSHALTLAALQSRYGVTVQVPAKAPLVKLAAGDTLLLLAVSGLPRLEGRHEYTAEEVAACSFRFARWVVA